MIKISAKVLVDLYALKNQLKKSPFPDVSNTMYISQNHANKANVKGIAKTSHFLIEPTLILFLIRI